MPPRMRPYYMKNQLSHATLSYEVSQLVEKKQLREAYALLPEANAIPGCINSMQRCMSSILTSMSELSDLMNENREELEQDWSQGEVQAFLAGAWQGFRASLVKVETDLLVQIYAPKR